MKYLFVFLIAAVIQCLLTYFINRNIPTKYSTVDYIHNNEYPIESHYVTTSDGYIINLHRIPRGKHSKPNGKVVLLEHGIFLSSSVWVLSGPGKALPYILADEGYDVWLGNARGNEYSRNHTTLNPDTDAQFWHFSWHEIGIYDLPASIEYILDQTNKDDLFYVGFSQGTTAMYVLLSMRPEYNTKIKAYAHLAPAAFMEHQKSPFFGISASFLTIFQNIIPTIEGSEMLSTDSFIHRLAVYLCPTTIGTFVCENIYYSLLGRSPAEMDRNTLSILALHMPVGASSKQHFHYSQEVNSGCFCQYDYGKNGNLAKYGRPTPPEYDLRKITAPGYLLYSGNDLVVDHIHDIPRLSNGLGNCTGTYFVPVSTFSHQDFLTGISAPNTIYSEVLNFFSKY